MQNHSKPIVGITQGDSNGIGYEVIIKALADPRILDSFTPVIYGSSKLFGFYRKTLHEMEALDTNIIQTAADAHPKRINIINSLPDNPSVEPGKATVDAAKAAICSLDNAVQELKAGRIDVLVTAPINKRTMNEAGFGFTGHTEYIAHAFDAPDVAMIMVSDTLRVAVATGHIPLREVAGRLSVEGIVRKLEILRHALRRDFGIIEPKIAVLGLNPHGGDGGLLGDEEQAVILPAVREAQARGIAAFGPYSPDGFFGLGHYQRFDATLAMYHDQGLAPFKALAFEQGVQFTAGLPVVRTSPDHGTAFDLAGRDQADPQSMRQALYTAVDIWRHRAAYDALHADAQ